MNPLLNAYLEDSLQKYLDELASLVSIDSGSYSKPGVDLVQQRISDRLSTLGFDVDLIEQARFGNDLIATRSGSGTRRILLLGHADTVYPDGTAHARPMTIEDDIVKGPGTCDMKAGILAGIFAIEALDHATWNAIDRLTFVVVSDEEIGDRHSIDLLIEQGRMHDAVLTLEAARENGDIVTSRKAGCQYSVEAKGESAHAGVEPEKGLSATLAMSRIVAETYELNEAAEGLTVNPGTITGGQQPNVIADHAVGRFDLRAWTNDGLDRLRASFEEVATHEWVPGVRATAALEPNSLCPAMEFTPGVEKLERAAIETARDIGFDVAGAATGGGSDVSFACRDGTPGLDGLGPVGGLDHGPDEYILKSSIVPRTTLLARLIQRIGEEEQFTYDQRAD